MVLGIYKFLSSMIAPALNILLSKRVKSGKEDKDRYTEKKGIAGIKRPEGDLIWFHAASVGEAQSVLAIIDGIKDCNILITTGTVTSANMLEKKLPSNALHQYVPLDHPVWVKRFLDYWKPDKVIWVESELWPNMLMQIKERNIPAYLLNGRMSKKSFSKWSKVPSSIRELLSCFSEIISQSDEDALRLDKLYGKKTHIMGNLKYLALPLPFANDNLQDLKDKIGNRPTWVYASTHKGEEEMAARLHLRLKEKHPELLTIIVPRHPDRGDAIIDAVKNEGDIKTCLRSTDGDNIADDTDIYIANTMGELGLFYELTDIAVIGRSFSDDGGGGHNPIEAAQLGCVVMHGPLIQNLQEIFDDFALDGSSISLKDEDDFYKWLDMLISDQNLRVEYIDKATNLVNSKKDGLNKIKEMSGI